MTEGLRSGEEFAAPLVAGAKSMFTTIWEYEVPAGRREAFINVYGAAGRWAILFRRSPGYLGTMLLHDLGDPDRFLTLDRWESRQAYEAFLDASRAEYDALDRETVELTIRERHLGFVTPEAGADP
jgi:heme-degrading monooxygenase HmoA